MSRKVLFQATLDRNSQLTERASVTPTAEQPANNPPHVTRHRMRPILGSPELLSDLAATPVGAIGQSLGEFSERAKRAAEIERQLTNGHVIVELDPGLIDPKYRS